MVSDIHLEAFWDPAKAAQLAAAPASGWEAILSAPASADQAQRFQALKQACPSRGDDTAPALFASSLMAMRANARQVKFATVSGDLVAHEFQCKFAKLFPGAKNGEYRSFVEKTIEYVIGQLQGALPGVPVYAALGNNDSDCGDYQLDAHSEFLASLAGAMTKGAAAGEQSQAQRDFGAGGYYSVALPAPIEHARLLVLDDQFLSRKYATCSGKPDATAGKAQLAWLRGQLLDARRNKEAVWVMGHIPPGIDPYSTIAKMTNVCGGQAPTQFLSSPELANTLSEFGDVIALAVFAHTHMDELRFVPAAAGQPKGVALKMVPSISPINGNSPSFTIAQIDPATAVMVDYKVIAAADASGAKWSQEYDFDTTYGQSAFSAAAVEKLVAGFKADPTLQQAASQSFIHNALVRGRSLPLTIFWPEYACSLSNLTPDSFRTCMCAGK